MDHEHHFDLIKKRLASISEPNWRWTRFEHGAILQGASLGDTLIVLDDTYDGSYEDCIFLEYAPHDIAWLIERYGEALQRNKALQDELANQGVRHA